MLAKKITDILLLIEKKTRSCRYEFNNIKGKITPNNDEVVNVNEKVDNNVLVTVDEQRGLSTRGDKAKASEKGTKGIIPSPKSLL